MRSGRPCAPGSCPSSPPTACRSASASQPLSGLRESSSASSQAATNSSGVEAILHAFEVAVMAHDVPDRRRHHRLPAGEIFGRLGRRDELRRFVHRERHQRDVPARQIGRQLVDRSCRRGNGCWAASAGRLRAIFTTGPTITNDQSGRISATCAEQLGVEALVDHAVEAEPRAAAGLPGRRGRTGARAPWRNARGRPTTGSNGRCRGGPSSLRRGSSRR